MGDEKEVYNRVVLFDDTNFPTWKFQMLALLEEYVLLECIEGEIEDVEEFKIEAEDTAELEQQKH